MSNYIDLTRIAGKMARGERLSREDGIQLFRSNDLLAIGEMANAVHKNRHSNRAYFIVNRHINHTNICVNRCKLCAFGRDNDSPGAYKMSLDEIEAKAAEAAKLNITEIHVVGGLNPALKLDYYVDMLQRLRRVLPGVIIQSFTGRFQTRST